MAEIINRGDRIPGGQKKEKNRGGLKGGEKISTHEKRPMSIKLTETLSTPRRKQEPLIRRSPLSNG